MTKSFLSIFCVSLSLFSADLLAKGKSKKPSVKTKIVSVQAVEPELQVFTENTSFEQIVANRELMQRNPAAFSPKARVIAVRRDLPLSEEEGKSSPKDIVLNEGTSAGLSEGMNLKVFRRVTLLDPYKNNKQVVMNVEYGTLEIEHVESNMAIARLTKIDPISKGFAIGTRGVMIGDFVGTP